MSSLLDALKWRYATKQFDATKRVSDTDLQTLRESIRLTATSFGLQPFRVRVVTDPDLKLRLRAAAYNQPQVSDASHVFVLASKTDMTPEYIENFIRMLAEQRGIAYDDVKGYADYIKKSVAQKDEETIRDWNRRQAYVALGSLLAAAGELRVDACPMEGFDAAQFDEILGLGDLGLTAAVICPVGYRSAEDQTQHYAKVRLPADQLFI